MVSVVGDPCDKAYNGIKVFYDLPMYVLLKKKTRTRLFNNFRSFGAQRLINLEIPVLVQSLKSSNVELGG